MPRKKKRYPQALSPNMRIRNIAAPKGFRVSSVSKTSRPRGVQIVFQKPKGKK